MLNLVSAQLIVIHSCFTGCRSLHKKRGARKLFPRHCNLAGRLGLELGLSSKETTQGPSTNHSAKGAQGRPIADWAVLLNGSEHIHLRALLAHENSVAARVGPHIPNVITTSDHYSLVGLGTRRLVIFQAVSRCLETLTVSRLLPLSDNVSHYNKDIICAKN